MSRRLRVVLSSKSVNVLRLSSRNHTGGNLYQDQAKYWIMAFLRDPQQCFMGFRDITPRMESGR